MRGEAAHNTQKSGTFSLTRTDVDYLFAPGVMIHQHIFTGKVDSEKPAMILGEGQALGFFKYEDAKGLQIGFDFEGILKEYFASC